MKDTRKISHKVKELLTEIHNHLALGSPPPQILIEQAENIVEEADELDLLATAPISEAANLQQLA